MPPPPCQPVRIAFDGAAPGAQQWAAVLQRCGLEVEVTGIAHASLLIRHGVTQSLDSPIPVIDVPRFSGDEDAWRAMAAPFFAHSCAAIEFSGGHELKFDIAALVAGLLEGLHEEPGSLDEHGRSPESASLLSSLGLLDTPIADRICRQFGALLAQLAGVSLPPARWWFFPTLDLDSGGMFSRVGFPSAMRQLARHRPGALPRAMVDGLRTTFRILKDPHIRHRQIGETLEGMGFHGAFFSQACRWHPLDNFDLRQGSEIARDLTAIRDNKFHDVGLHSSYATLDRGSRAWDRQWSRLHAAIGGCSPIHRSHYLRWPSREAWPSPAKAPYVDSSLGYGRREGFRRATAFPFPLSADAVELPPVAMDSTFIHHRRMAPDGAFESCVGLMESTQNTGGAMTVVWHPHNMDDYLFPGWGDVLYDLVREASRRGAQTLRPAAFALAHHRRHRELSHAIHKDSL